jgi:hypothetical protein
MNPIPTPSRLAGAALALAAAGANAQMHQICYEGLPENGHRTIVVGCRDDAGGHCKVSAISNAAAYNPTGNSFVWPNMPLHQFAIYRATAGSLPVQATLDFTDAAGQLKAQRSCTVSLGVHQQHGDRPSPGTYLEGYSTDASGRVMTGVWRAHFTMSGNDVTVPGDFIAISGGVQTSPGAFVMRSERRSPGTWSTRSFDDATRIPASTVTYAVGLKIEGLPAVDETAFNEPGTVIRQGLASLLQRDAAFTPGVIGGAPEAIPAATASSPLVDRVAVSGEFSASAHHSNSVTLRGQYASVSAPRMGLRVLRCLLVGTVCPPAFADGWRSESKDDLGAHPGGLSVGYWHLPAKIEIDGQPFELRGKVVQASAAVGTQPSATAGGLLGEYAVTAAGGEVQWRPFNTDPKLASNRLVQLRAVMDGKDSTAASDHGSVITPAALTAYALGIKLVPAGTPPDGDGRPFLRARDIVSPGWLCSAFAGLEGWRGCEEHKLLRVEKVCATYPELREHGLCGRP